MSAEAGMYEEGLSQAVKDQIVQFLQESRESARQEEQERLTQQFEEDRILTEAINSINIHEVIRDSERQGGQEVVESDIEIKEKAVKR